MHIGHWDGRVRQHGINEGSQCWQQFIITLACTWSVPVRTLVDRAEITWKEKRNVIPKVIPATAYDLPDPRSFWDLEGVPVLVRGLVKTQELEDIQKSNYIKPEAKPALTLLGKRMSKNVFKEYLNGKILPPAPIVEGVSQKFGRHYKLKALQMLHRVLSIENIGVNDLERYALTIENWMIRCFRSEKQRAWQGL